MFFATNLVFLERVDSVLSYKSVAKKNLQPKKKFKDCENGDCENGEWQWPFTKMQKSDSAND